MVLVFLSLGMLGTTAQEQVTDLDAKKTNSDSGMVERRITFSNAFPIPSPIVFDGWFPDNTYTVELIHSGKRLAVAPIISRGIFNSPEVKVSGSGESNEIFTLRLYKTEYGSFDAAVKASHTKPNLAFSMENFPAETGDPGSRAPTLEKAMANGKWKSFGLTDFNARTRNVIDLIAPVNVNIPGQGSGEITFSNVFGIPQLIEINGWKPDRNYTVELIHNGKILAKAPIIFNGAFNSLERIPIEGADASEEIITLRLYKTSYGSFEAAVRASGNESNTAFSLDDFPVMTGPARRPAPPPPGLNEGMKKGRWKSYGLTDFSASEGDNTTKRYLRFSNRALNSYPILINGFIPGSDYKVELVHNGAVVAKAPIEDRGFFNGSIVEIPGSETPHSTVSLRLYHSRFADWDAAVIESGGGMESAYVMENISVFTRKYREGLSSSVSALGEGMQQAYWSGMRQGIPIPETTALATSEKTRPAIINLSNIFLGPKFNPLIIHGCPINENYRIELVHERNILSTTEIDNLGRFSGGTIEIPDLSGISRFVSLRVYKKEFSDFHMAVENADKIPNAAFSIDDIDLSFRSSPPNIWTFDRLLIKYPWKTYGEYKPSRDALLRGGLGFSNQIPFESPIYIPELTLDKNYVIELEHRNTIIARRPFISDGYFNGSNMQTPDKITEIAEMNLHIYKKEYTNFQEALADARSINNQVYSLVNFMKVTDMNGNMKGIYPNISSALHAKQGEWQHTSSIKKPGPDLSEKESSGRMRSRITTIAIYALIIFIVLIPALMPYLR